MASPSLGQEIFSLGFRFNPSPLDAATYYLPRLAAGAPLHEAVRPVVHRADVYASEPGDLARQFRPLPKTGHRFFFTHCKLQQPPRAGKTSRAARAAGAGSWHSQGATDVLDGAGVKVGEMRKLRYKKGGAYTDWLMDEFSTLCSEAVVGDRQFVLCDIYVSPRAAPDSAARRESAAFFAPRAPAVIAQAVAATRRPAPPQIAEPPFPKRMRGAVVSPIPPVVQPCVPYTAASAPPPPVPIRFTAPPPAAVPTRLAAPSPPPVPSRFATPPPVPTRLAARPPVPTRFAAPPLIRSPTPAPPQPRQQMPLSTPPLVRACQIPAVQAPASHCPPQPSEKKTKQRMLDPFEAAGVRDEAEDDRDDLRKCLGDDAEGSTMTADEVDQHFASLWED